VSGKKWECPYKAQGQECEECSLYGYCPETREDGEQK